MYCFLYYSSSIPWLLSTLSKNYNILPLKIALPLQPFHKPGIYVSMREPLNLVTDNMIIETMQWGIIFHFKSSWETEPNFPSIWLGLISCLYTFAQHLSLLWAQSLLLYLVFPGKLPNKELLDSVSGEPLAVESNICLPFLVDNSTQWNKATRR